MIVICVRGPCRSVHCCFTYWFFHCALATRVRTYWSVALNVKRAPMKFQYGARILYELPIAYVNKCSTRDTLARTSNHELYRF